MMRLLGWILSICLCATLSADTGLAIAAAPTAEEIAAADALLSQHLPELRSLVDVLQKRAPKEYGKAIRDLSKSSKRLEGFKKRDRQLYDLEVQFLQAQVKVDLVTAQLQVASLPSLEKDLRSAIDQRAKVRIARNVRQKQLLLDRHRQVSQEIKRLEDQLLEQNESFQVQTQREFDQIVRRAGQVRQKTSSGES
jgi:hypothetical protein